LGWLDSRGERKTEVPFQSNGKIMLTGANHTAQLGKGKKH
jgi:hypothetical protein